MVDKIGMIGLGPMGTNLSRNMLRKGIEVIGYDNSAEARAQAQTFGIPVARSWEELRNSFKGRRAYWVMVPDKAVDTVLTEIYAHPSPGDIVIEGGNSHFKDTERRVRDAHENRITYIGTGVSGGEEGALKGPCIMPGGDKQAYDVVVDMLQRIAAKVDGEPCVTYIGPGGAGHFVKIVHNGIEYAIMQAIAESYSLMRDGYNLSADQIHQQFRSWSKGKLRGYLLNIVADILNVRDPESGKLRIDVVKDTAANKGTGKWTSQTAYDLGVPVQNISTAYLARILSSYNLERLDASNVLHYCPKQVSYNENRLKAALQSSMILSYAQGFHMMRVGSREYGYSLNLEAIARIWRGGCIIRSSLLEDIREEYHEDPQLHQLPIVFADRLNRAVTGLRKVVMDSHSAGVPVPVLSQSLNYFDTIRSARLESAALIQLMRDYFGAHTYQRNDKEGNFHTLWSGDRSEIRK